LRQPLLTNIANKIERKQAEKDKLCEALAKTEEKMAAVKKELGSLQTEYATALAQETAKLLLKEKIDLSALTAKSIVTAIKNIESSEEKDESNSTDSQLPNNNISESEMKNGLTNTENFSTADSLEDESGTSDYYGYA